MGEEEEVDLKEEKKNWTTTCHKLMDDPFFHHSLLKAAFSCPFMKIDQKWVFGDELNGNVGRKNEAIFPNWQWAPACRGP